MLRSRVTAGRERGETCSLPSQRNQRANALGRLHKPILPDARLAINRIRDVRKRPPFFKQYIDATRSRALGLSPELYGWLEMFRAAYWDCNSRGRPLEPNPREIAVMLQHDPRAVRHAISKLSELGRLEVTGGQIVFADLAEQLAEYAKRGNGANIVEKSGGTSHPTSVSKSAPIFPETRAKSVPQHHPHVRASQKSYPEESIDSEIFNGGIDVDGDAEIARLALRAQSETWRRDERRWLTEAIPKFVRDDRGLRLWLATLEGKFGPTAVTEAIAAARPYVESGAVPNVQGYITDIAKKRAGQRSARHAGGLQ